MHSRLARFRGGEGGVDIGSTAKTVVWDSSAKAPPRAKSAAAAALATTVAVEEAQAATIKRYKANSANSSLRLTMRAADHSSDHSSP